MDYLLITVTNIVSYCFWSKLYTMYTFFLAIITLYEYSELMVNLISFNVMSYVKETP